MNKKAAALFNANSAPLQSRLSLRFLLTLAKKQLFRDLQEAVSITFVVSGTRLAAYRPPDAAEQLHRTQYSRMKSLHMDGKPTDVKWFEIDMRPGGMVRRNFEATKYDLEGRDRFDFHCGKPVMDWRGDGWISSGSTESDGPAEDVLRTSNLLPVFSKRLRHLCETNGVNGLQFLPLRVFDSNRNEIGNYFLVNVLNTVAALDYEASEIRISRYKLKEGGYKEWVSHIPKLVLRNSQLPGFDLIQLPEQTGFYYVSDRFRKLFTTGGFTGWGFRKVELSER